MPAPGPAASLNDWLTWQQGLNPNVMDLGLDRVHTVYAALSLERPDLVVTVAGTNGKGSAVAMLRGLLTEPGQPVGTFTSPHLIRYNERIAVDGEPLPDAEIVAAFERIEAVRGDVALTYFEYAALAALVAFDAMGVSIVVLEVGLGGRLDAVNAIPADAALITSIDLDHQRWLGNTRELIGREKAGIFRAGAPACFAGPEVPDSVLEHARRCATPLWVAGRDYTAMAQPTGGFSLKAPSLDFQAAALGIPGKHQVANAAGVVALLHRLGRLPDDASQRLANVSLAGRFQKLGRGPVYILDVAHNPAAAERLAENLSTDPCSGRTLAVCGFLRDKDVAGSIRPLAGLVSDWSAVSIARPRGLPALELGQVVAALTGVPCALFDTFDAAHNDLKTRLRADDRIVVFGSFYLVGPVLETLAL